MTAELYTLVCAICGYHGRLVGVACERCHQEAQTDEETARLIREEEQRQMDTDSLPATVVGSTQETAATRAAKEKAGWAADVKVRTI